MNDWNFSRETEEIKTVGVSGVELGCGERVRLREQETADIMDLALARQIAVIESIEEDYNEHVRISTAI